MGDITHIGTSGGWLCLAVVVDAWHRKVVGWSMPERITEELAVDALEQAVGREDPLPISASRSTAIRASSTRPAHSSAARSPTG